MRRILFILSTGALCLVMLWAGSFGFNGSVQRVAAQDAPSSTPTLTPTDMQATEQSTEAATDQAPLTAAQALQLTLQAGLPMPTYDLSTLPPAAQVSLSSDGTAPDFSVLTFDNKTFKLSDYRGKIVLINFWASWCGPCRQEMPDLGILWNNYKDKDVMFIGIASQDDPTQSRLFAQNHRVAYSLGSDVDNSIASAYAIRAFPTTILLDRNGFIKSTLVGGIDPVGMPALLDGLLAQ